MNHAGLVKVIMVLFSLMLISFGVALLWGVGKTALSGEIAGVEEWAMGAGLGFLAATFIVTGVFGILREFNE